ncbi:type II secretion system F family protein [Campylobacter sp. MIT 12-5580]|uniref:type II secretion system F family protein n=1 Tax=Campylobacter sp. MIT 12-5580 TaxID=2040651 RepID=UPI0010F679FC|nr:type II secretion system F family protein [Campylobacter sp. MIT 12-5580]TKX30239.1 type II secretion system F family protein [Campylobacter sp. MIT 12-5580]
MKKFSVLIKSKNKTKSLIIKAQNKLKAQDELRAKGFNVLHIEEFRYFDLSLKPQILALLFKELSLLLGAGVSVSLAFKELKAHHKDTKIKLFLTRILQALQSGQSLNIAFENSGFAFDRAELALIKMGENTGDLSSVFLRLCELREKSLNNTKRLKKALAYPLFVFVSLIVVFCALMLFVVPEFKLIFDDFELELPFITRFMLAIYNFLQDFFVPLLVLCCVFLIFFVYLYKKNHDFAYFNHALLLKIPFFSKLIFYNQNTHFFMIFALLLQSALPLQHSLKLARMSLSNLFLQEKFQKLDELCEQGLRLDEAFKRLALFEPIVLSMLAVAMKSSKLHEMSAKIAEYYELKQNHIMDTFLLLLEPLMTLFVAVLVLFLALGIFLPMWELNSGVSF